MKGNRTMAPRKHKLSPRPPCTSCGAAARHVYIEPDGRCTSCHNNPPGERWRGGPIPDGCALYVQKVQEPEDATTMLYEALSYMSEGDRKTTIDRLRALLHALVVGQDLPPIDERDERDEEWIFHIPTK